MNKATKIARFKANGGREGIAKRILEVAKQIVEKDSYKRAVAGAGQMRQLAEICEADSYWDEKASHGYQVESDIMNGRNKIEFRSDATLAFETEVKIPLDPEIGPEGVSS